MMTSEIMSGMSFIYSSRYIHKQYFYNYDNYLNIFGIGILKTGMTFESYLFK